MTIGKCLISQNCSPLTISDFKHLFNAAMNKIPNKRGILVDHEFVFIVLGEAMQKKVAIAVSGGSDSMALASLASEFLGPQNVVGMIVDHQLQNYGVSEDPNKVQDNLVKVGIRSRILKLSWSDQASGNISLIPGKIMQQSRDNRYRALFDACENEGASFLLTGHNLEDDIITMFHRISRMSGIDGLAGMKLATTFPFASYGSDSKYILRPLLTVPKRQLVNTCVDRGVSWTHDQSNDDLSFRRNECLSALIQLQSENPSIETELLAKFLGSFKKHRSYIHEKGNFLFF